MSAAPTQNTRRRRRQNKEGGASKLDASTASATPTAAAASSDEPTEFTPVPDSFVGQTKLGVITKLMRNYGFINICPGPLIKYDSPRIYFNFENLNNEPTIGLGYFVNFVCCVDEKGKKFADKITLTKKSKQILSAKSTGADETATAATTPANTVPTAATASSTVADISPRSAKKAAAAERVVSCLIFQFVALIIPYTQRIFSSNYTGCGSA